MVEDYLFTLIVELDLHRLRRPYIVVEFVTKAETYGYCVGDRDSATITISKTCPYSGDRLSFTEMMMTLAHEMVHAKQFLRGDLRSEPNWWWKGRNAVNYQYINQPWERQAFAMERELFWSCFPFSAPFQN